ncbi:MAG TPA: efflux RND transporter periplasmic adaptor subunit, partial [Burkholderiaceae bacterium]|nr:efflux RND transporter periplasmic adaptor subunit [Burkholderiaceae bacterium]
MNPSTETHTAEASEASDDVDSLLGTPAPGWWRRPTSWLAVLAIAAVIGGSGFWWTQHNAQAAPTYVTTPV